MKHVRNPLVEAARRKAFGVLADHGRSPAWRTPAPPPGSSEILDTGEQQRPPRPEQLPICFATPASRSAKPSRWIKARALERMGERPLVTGDATPTYLFGPRRPAMVSEHLPSVQLIVLLRDPAERAVSRYWMEFERGAGPDALSRRLGW